MFLHLLSLFPTEEYEVVSSNLQSGFRNTDVDLEFVNLYMWPCRLAAGICFGVFGLTYRLQADLGSVLLNNVKDFLYEQINANKYCDSNKTPGTAVQSCRFPCMPVRGFVSTSGFGSASAILCSWKPKSSKSHWTSEMTEQWFHSMLSAQEWSVFQANGVFISFSASQLLLSFQILSALTCVYMSVCLCRQAIK